VQAHHTQIDPFQDTGDEQLKTVYLHADLPNGVLER
jgi:hypothetical protein